MFGIRKRKSKNHCDKIQNKKISKKYLSDGIILGQNAFKSFEGNNNVVVIGSSGTGKSYSFVEPNLLQMNSSFVVSDAKGQLLKDTGKILLENGYDVKVLNLCDLSNSMHYNPLHYIFCPQDILYLGYCVNNSSVTGEKTRTNDTFWQQSAMMLFNAIVFYLWYEIRKEDRTMSNAIKLLNKERIDDDRVESSKSTLDIMFEDLEKRTPDHEAVLFYKKYKIGAGRTKASIVISLQANLMQYSLSEVRKITSYDELELDQLGKKKMAVFVVYDDTDPTKNFLSNILYSQVFKILCRQASESPDGKLDIPVQIFLDDFFNVSIPNFEYYIATIRSRAISTCIMLQDESQLKAKYGVAFNSIIANCLTYIFTGTTDLRAAKEQSERFHKSPEEIRRMDEDKFLVSCNGTEFQVNRFSPTLHPNYTDGSKFDYIDYIKSQELKAPKQEKKPPFKRRSIIDDIDISEKESKEKRNEIGDRSLPFTGQRQRRNIESKTSTNRPVGLKEVIDATTIRESFFDSKSEKLLYDKLIEYLKHTNLFNLVVVHTGVSLSNFMKFDYIKNRDLWLKARLMHCDYLIRDSNNLTPIVGIELDGPQHEETESYMINDLIKDKLFRKCDIPLIRIPVECFTVYDFYDIWKNIIKYYNIDVIDSNNNQEKQTDSESLSQSRFDKEGNKNKPVITSDNQTDTDQETYSKELYRTFINKMSEYSA